MPLPFEILEHTADLRLRATGKSPKQLFANALEGMSEIIKPSSSINIRSGSFTASRQFSIKSVDFETLLVDFLNEALYLGNVYKEIYKDVKFSKLAHAHCAGIFKGVKVGRFEKDIKAATYHDLAITERHDGYLEATIVVDI